MIDIAQEGLPREGRWLKALTDTREMSPRRSTSTSTCRALLRVGDEVRLSG